MFSYCGNISLIFEDGNRIAGSELQTVAPNSGAAVRVAETSVRRNRSGSLSSLFEFAYVECNQFSRKAFVKPEWLYIWDAGDPTVAEDQVADAAVSLLAGGLWKFY